MDNIPESDRHAFLDMLLWRSGVRGYTITENWKFTKGTNATWPVMKDRPQITGNTKKVYVVEFED